MNDFVHSRCSSISRQMESTLRLKRLKDLVMLENSSGIEMKKSSGDFVNVMRMTLLSNEIYLTWNKKTNFGCVLPYV